MEVSAFFSPLFIDDAVSHTLEEFVKYIMGASKVFAIIY